MTKIVEYLVSLVVLLSYEWIQGINSYKNVVFIVSDDLRTQLNPFLDKNNSAIRNFPRMYTPNLDKFAERSIVFKHAYCQYSLCAPSRASVLTGRRPDTTRTYDLATYFRTQAGNFTTIPQYFKEKGYISLGVGKIFHQGKASGNNDPISWTENQNPITDAWWNKRIYWEKLSKMEVKNNGYLQDQIVTQHSVKLLDELGLLFKTQQQPFFLAVGYRKPHLPFAIPEEFFKYYNNIETAENYFAPQNMPDIAFNKNREMTGRHYNFPTGINETLPLSFTKDMRRAYYAAVSFVDFQVGQVIDRITRNGLTESTIVVFWGDHGFHLGENGSWGKQQNFDIDQRVPLIIHIPGLTNQGLVSNDLVELVDLFPTLVEAAGFPPLKPCPRLSQDVNLCTEGDSLLPVINQPGNTQWKKAVFSQVHFPHKGVTKTYKQVGYSVQTARYKYTEWHPFNGITFEVNWDQLTAVELYDHFTDPGETKNAPLESCDNDTINHLRQLLWEKFDKMYSKNAEKNNLMQNEMSSLQEGSKNKLEETYHENVEQVHLRQEERSSLPEETENKHEKTYVFNVKAENDSLQYEHILVYFFLIPSLVITIYLKWRKTVKYRL